MMLTRQHYYPILGILARIQFDAAEPEVGIGNLLADVLPAVTVL